VEAKPPLNFSPEELLVGIAVGLAEGQGRYTEDEALAVFAELEGAEDHGTPAQKAQARLVRERRVTISLGEDGSISYSSPESPDAPNELDALMPPPSLN